MTRQPVSRRDFLKGAAAAAAACATPVSAQTTAPTFLYVGTYTRAPRTGRGILIYHFDPVSGGLTPVTAFRDVDSPSFLTVDPHRRVLYAVNEIGDFLGPTTTGAVSAFAIDQTSGNLTFLNRLSSEGRTPAHLAVEPTGRYLLVATYTGGTAVCYPILSDGQIGRPSDIVTHTGQPGPNRGPQTQARAHMILPDPSGFRAMVPDLGLDQIFVYVLDGSTGRFGTNDPPHVHAAPGAGPRHLAYHPNGRNVYVINELNSTLAAYAYDSESGVIYHLQTQTTLPASFTEANATAHVMVHPSGRFVYGSNRGHNSIAIFAVDPDSGRLSPLGHESTQGRTPRNFNIDPSGNFMFVGNQDTDNFVSYRINQSTGGLTPTGLNIAEGAPVCFVFAPPEPAGSSRQPGVTFWANPNPIVISDRFGYGRTTLAWSAPGARNVEIRIDAPDGVNMGLSLGAGSAQTGRWVHDGMTFYLQDVTDGKPLTAANTLGVVQAGVR